MDLEKIPFIHNILQKACYVLTVGEEGAILTYIRKDRLELRLFASFASTNDMKNLRKVLSDNKKAPIYLLIDSGDQTYTPQTLPAVSPLTIGNLARKRLERDFASMELKGSFYIGRAESGRRDWHYLFIGASITPNLTNWLNLVKELPNPFGGIYLLPLQVMGFVKQLNEALFQEKRSNKQLFTATTKQPVKKPSTFQIYVSHNKVAGIRQVVLKCGKIIFTRLIVADNDTLPDIIAGNIEQELLNSIEYLKRQAFKENDTFDVFIIASQEIKRTLETSKLPGKHVFLLTPSDVATLLQLKNAATQEDRFADVVLALSFAQQSRVLPMYTKEIRILAYMDRARTAIRSAALVLFPVLLLHIAYMGFLIIAANQQISQSQEQRNMINAKWQQLQKNNYTMEDTSKISDVVKLYKLLTGEVITPLAIIADFGSVKSPDVLVKSIEWKLKDLPNIKPAPDAHPTPIMVVVFDVEFRNKSSSFEGLFENFDAFIGRLKTKFQHYDVEYSRLPEKITFNAKNNVIPVQVTITGPKESKAKPEGSS